MDPQIKLEKEAKKLAQQRKALGHTQKSFAGFLGCSKSAVIAWENRQNTIPEWVWLRLNDNRARLSPRFTLAEHAAIERKARESGQTVLEWMESVIKKALVIGFIGLAAWVWASS